MRNYYVLNNGRVRREANTLYVEQTDGAKKPLPIEDVESLYLYGEIDLNTRLLNFLSQKKIPLHVFNYYGFYSGSYYPRDYLHSGFLLTHQAAHYLDAAKRAALAAELVRASAHSLLRNLKYYERRRGARDNDGPEREPSGEIGGEPVSEAVSAIPTDAETEASVDAALKIALSEREGESEDNGEALASEFLDDIPDDPEHENNDSFLPHSFSDEDGEAELSAGESLARIVAVVSALAGQAESLKNLPNAEDFDINILRGVEGKMRERYYAGWRHILRDDTPFDTLRRRTRRPPSNEINALISFGNGFLYTVCLSEIYRTQLTPTISYLHEPGARRFSLALDLSEIFKPLIVDRAIFRLWNAHQLKPSHFDRTLGGDKGGCYLTDAGKRLFITALEERLTSTIKHRRLGRHVSYRHLIRLECYKLIRHLTGVEPYRAFRAWW